MRKVLIKIKENDEMIILTTLDRFDCLARLREDMKILTSQEKQFKYILFGDGSGWLLDQLERKLEGTSVIFQRVI